MVEDTHQGTVDTARPKMGKRHDFLHVEKLIRMGGVRNLPIGKDYDSENA